MRPVFKSTNHLSCIDFVTLCKSPSDPQFPYLLSGNNILCLSASQGWLKTKNKKKNKKKTKKPLNVIIRHLLITLGVHVRAIYH